MHQMPCMQLNNQQVQEVIRKVKNGDTNAYAGLVHQFERPVFSMCLQMLKDRDLAADAAQETFIKAYEHLAGFRMEAKFSTWLYRIAFNQCGVYLRKLKKQVIISHEDAEANYVLDSHEDDWNSLESKERQQIIHQCIQELAADDQLVLNLFYLEEQSLEEMEKITGVNRNTLKVKLHRARQRLEKKLRSTLTDLN